MAKHRKTPDNPEGLTPKQIKWKDKYLETGVQVEASRLAYPNTDYHTQRQIAYENMTKPDILKAIDRELTEKDLTNAFVIERIAKETKDENPVIRLKALELIGKYRKMFTDKVDHTHILEGVKAIGWASGNPTDDDEDQS